MIDKEILKLMGYMIAVITLLFAIAATVDLTTRIYSCETHGEMYETESEFRVFGGCYLERDGRMIRVDDYKYVELRGEQ